MCYELIECQDTVWSGGEDVLRELCQMQFTNVSIRRSPWRAKGRADLRVPDGCFVNCACQIQSLESGRCRCEMLCCVQSRRSCWWHTDREDVRWHPSEGAIMWKSQFGKNGYLNPSRACCNSLTESKQIWVSVLLLDCHYIILCTQCVLCYCSVLVHAIVLMEWPWVVCDFSQFLRSIPHQKSVGCLYALIHCFLFIKM